MIEWQIVFICVTSLISTVLGVITLLFCQENKRLLAQNSLAGDIKQLETNVREEIRAAFAVQWQQLEARLNTLDQSSENRFANFSNTQSEQISSLRTEAVEGRKVLEESLKQATESFGKIQTEKLNETNESMKDLALRLEKQQKEAQEAQDKGLDKISVTLKDLSAANDKKQTELRDSLDKNLEKLRQGNEQKLEEMRVTVDEKLQGTLEKRLGESFQLVSDRLEQVHKGLGEMQSLATGVGDLKRVLMNVKSRGGWGEVQLGILLGDMLTPDQFEQNVKIAPDRSEVVEYAIRLPGKGDDRPVYLPVDAKFPQEDYERLLQAHDAGTSEDISKAVSALEKAIKVQAKAMCDKYICPPYSTDFAIMYLPTEGLFAEVIRRPGLVSELQVKHRVMVTGPTTFAALLNSLQMGFKTLAIEKRSSEVWQVLSAVKSEFIKYGEVWDKLGKQLTTAQNTVQEAGKRTRAVHRKLSGVEATPSLEQKDVLSLTGIEMDDGDTDEPDTSFGSAA